MQNRNTTTNISKTKLKKFKIKRSLFVKMNLIDLPQNQNSVDEGARIVNDKVFENIVARIESIEKGQKILLENQKKIVAASPSPSPIPSPAISTISDEKFIQLSESYDVLKVEINQIKDLLLNLQSFTMETNKKLSEIVFNDFNDYDNDANIILCDNNEILASNILEEENILVVEENKDEENEDTNLQLSETTI